MGQSTRSPIDSVMENMANDIYRIYYVYVQYLFVCDSMVNHLQIASFFLHDIFHCENWNDS